jgi:hypothetical protein
MNSNTSGWTRWLTTRSIGLVAASLTAALTVTPSFAQTRAALVKNVDEPGRAPYQSVVDFNAGSGCGSNTSCNFVSFAAVPAGKRLVVEHLSVLTGVASGGQPTLLAFSNSPGCGNCSNRAVGTGWVNTDFSPGFGASFWAIDRPVYLFYEAGETPQIKMYATVNFIFVGNATVTGYLIDANN